MHSEIFDDTEQRDIEQLEASFGELSFPSYLDEWPAARKSALVSGIVSGLVIYAAALLHYAAQHPAEVPFIDPAVLALQIQLSHGVLVLWVLLALVSLAARGRFDQQEFFLHAPIQLFAISNAMFSYFFGTWTVPYGAVVLIGGVVAALPVFGRRPTLLGAGMWALVTVALTVLEQQGVVPYAPLFNGMPIVAGHLSPQYLVGIGSITVIGILLCGILFIAAIHQLQARDRDLRRNRERLLASLNELHQSHEAIRQVNAELEVRVEDRVDELQTAHDRLSRELRERNLFEEERKVLEAELQHAQRLESVGQLAGGVAHDFNNLLTVIGGNVEMLLDLPGSMTGEQLAWLSEVQAATERAASVTGQLLAYSRKQAVVLQMLEANSVVEGMRRMIERAAGEQIRVEIESPDSVGKVRAGLGQIEQVLMNLVLNACDAMPHGGTLRIEMTAVSRLPSAITKSPASEKPHVVLRVSDTGDGMDEAVCSRVFEPFFTTKAPGKGTGLGLSVVHGIVTQHHGFLEVESSLGKGTCFSIYLPVVEADGSRTQDGGASSAEESGRGETILVVEDDPGVRRVTSRLLKNQGYIVLIAESGEQALEIAENHSGSVDLLLTDVVMPGLQGPELASSLLRLYPGATVLFVSGYTDPERFVDLNLNERRAFLQKPFTRETLEREVSALLKRPSSTPHESAG